MVAMYVVLQAEFVVLSAPWVAQLVAQLVAKLDVQFAEVMHLFELSPMAEELAAQSLVLVLILSLTLPWFLS